MAMRRLMSWLAYRMVGLFDRVFGVWERTGLARPLRENTEIVITRAAAALWNLAAHRLAARDAARGYPALHRYFEERTGYSLNLHAPETLQQKIQWRKIHDRNPLLPVLADKQAAKDWIHDRLGEDLTVPTLFQVRSPRDLPEDIATRELVLKVTHASHRNIFVTPDCGLTRGAILRRIARYLYLDYGTRLHEWAYSEVDRSIIAEPILRDGAGNIPDDARFLMLDGKLRYIFYTAGELDPETCRPRSPYKIHIGPDWTLLPVTRKGDVPGPLPPRPAAFERMVAIAERLAAEIDHLRVDFFLLDDRFYISEMTIYHTSGFKCYEPYRFDRELGALWTLPA